MSQSSIAADSASDPSNRQYLFGFDPGRDKCGLAVALVSRTSVAGGPSTGTSDKGKLDKGGSNLVEICHREIARSDEVEARLKAQYDAFQLDPEAPLDFVMGNQTTARRWEQRLLQAFPHLDIHLVDERFSSQEARQRYWSIYPARGLQRLVPLGMREPPRPIDDIVAQILIERYLHREGSY